MTVVTFQYLFFREENETSQASSGLDSYFFHAGLRSFEKLEWCCKLFNKRLNHKAVCSGTSDQPMFATTHYDSLLLWDNLLRHGAYRGASVRLLKLCGMKTDFPPQYHVNHSRHTFLCKHGKHANTHTQLCTCGKSQSFLLTLVHTWHRDRSTSLYQWSFSLMWRETSCTQRDENTLTGQPPHVLPRSSPL